MVGTLFANWPFPRSFMAKSSHAHHRDEDFTEREKLTFQYIESELLQLSAMDGTTLLTALAIVLLKITSAPFLA